MFESAISPHVAQAASSYSSLYGSSSYYPTTSASSGGMGVGFIILIVVLLLMYLAAWFVTMTIVTRAAREKGYDDLDGKLWFIGLFGLIFTPGIIVAALPDKKTQKALSEEGAEKAVESELPSI